MEFDKTRINCEFAAFVAIALIFPGGIADSPAGKALEDELAKKLEAGMEPIEVESFLREAYENLCRKNAAEPHANPE
jgi:hypothetical protein